MAYRVLYPLDGFPTTRTAVDRNGRTAWTVASTVLTPVGARTADQITGIASLGLGTALIYKLALPFDHSVFHWVCAAGVWYVTRAGARAAMRGVLKVTTHTKFTPDYFAIRSGFRWTRYDLNRPHSFALVQHLRAQQEMRENELAQREAATRGKAVQSPVYFGDAYHVVFVYDGHFHYLFDVLGRAWGEAIVNRFHYICRERANESKHKGDGNPQAKQDWHASPGGLDDV